MVLFERHCALEMSRLLVELGCVAAPLRAIPGVSGILPGSGRRRDASLLVCSPAPALLLLELSRLSPPYPLLLQRAGVGRPPHASTPSLRALGACDLPGGPAGPPQEGHFSPMMIETSFHSNCFRCR